MLPWRAVPPATSETPPSGEQRRLRLKRYCFALHADGSISGFDAITAFVFGTCSRASRASERNTQTMHSNQIESPTHAPSQTYDDETFKQQALSSVTEFFEPAIEGPPSPGRLRQLSQQMKRASHLHRPHGHQAASSASSSLRSSTGDRGDRPQWEQALDNFGLVRRPSDRSTGSSTPSSRDYPDSSHGFGKAMFGIPGKSKRESSGHSSSSSSLYSTDMHPEGFIAGPKEQSFMPALFNRRKQSRDELVPRRPQISGPFNFQHVSHTERDHVPGPHQTSLTEATCTSPSGGLNVAEADGLDVPSGNFSTGSAHLRQLSRSSSGGRPALVPRHTAPVTGHRRLVKHVRSQDYLQASPSRPAPPRPPRSPTEPTQDSAGPVPPPRVSSRMSFGQDGSGSLASSVLDRPQTSSGLRRPQLRGAGEDAEWHGQPATWRGHVSTPARDAPPVPRESVGYHAFGCAGDGAWPLVTGFLPTGYETPLPDVPEEDEHIGAAHRSRMSLGSNRSSLRASQSAPMLRSLLQTGQPPSDGVFEDCETLREPDGQDPRRPASRAQEEIDGLGPMRENWEEVVDYCYEHEAEADCDYEWERPSLDGSRADTDPSAHVAGAGRDVSVSGTIPTGTSLRGVPWARSDLPALSPTSQTSKIGGVEAISPMSPPGVTSNFSFPRMDKTNCRPAMLNTSRPISCASSFKESQGFTLSPSLLIPGDYHQQLLMNEAEKGEYLGDEELVAHGTHSYPAGASPQSSNSPRPDQQRSSTSTMETSSTSRTNSTVERHASSNSTWTSLTRLTASTTSLNKMVAAVAEDPEPVPSTQAEDVEEEDTEQETTPPASKDSLPELHHFPTSLGRKVHHKSHASESLVGDEVPPMKSADMAKTRRARARTSSLSTQAPPVGQYALFPKTNIKANGGQI